MRNRNAEVEITRFVHDYAVELPEYFDIPVYVGYSDTPRIVRFTKSVKVSSFERLAGPHLRVSYDAPETYAVRFRTGKKIHVRGFFGFSASTKEYVNGIPQATRPFVEIPSAIILGTTRGRNYGNWKSTETAVGWTDELEARYGSDWMAKVIAK